MEPCRTRQTPRTSRARRLFVAAGLSALVADALTNIARAVDVQASEYQIKAAYLCKFAAYVEWPAASTSEATAPIVIGLVASDAVAAEMASTLQGQSVGNRPIVMRRIDPQGRWDGLNVLFVARTHSARLPEALAALQGRPVLTVAESDAPGDSTSMVKFVVIDDKVKFDVALALVLHSGLKISARLLAVAHVVTGRDT